MNKDQCFKSLSPDMGITRAEEDQASHAAEKSEPAKAANDNLGHVNGVTAQQATDTAGKNENGEHISVWLVEQNINALIAEFHVLLDNMNALLEQIKSLIAQINVLLDKKLASIQAASVGAVFEGARSAPSKDQRPVQVESEERVEDIDHQPLAYSNFDSEKGGHDD